MSTKQDRSAGRGAAVAVALAAASAGAVLGGCRGDRSDKPPRQFFPDMDDQPKWDPQGQTAFYGDARQARTPPAGTVAYGRMPINPLTQADAPWAGAYMAQRVDFLAEDDAVYRGKSVNADGTSSYVAMMPVPVTRELLEIGRSNFNIYCATCHGLEGNGQGQVAARWSIPVANLTIAPFNDRTQERGTDGYLWQIGREGLWNDTTGANRMPAYKHAISEMEMWAVVAYIRALQRSAGGTLDDLNEADRERLSAGRGAQGGA